MLSDRTHFNLRKLHSLTGVVPIGAFLLEHLFTNSFAIFGADAFNEKVRFLTSLPYLYLIETVFIFLPIAFHAILGVAIAFTARHNVRTMRYGRNWAYFFQRISGLFLVAFILAHLVKTRFSGTPPEVMFQHMAGYLPNPFWFAFYVLGVVSAAYHFGNGLFTFAISWGITIGKRSQRVWSIACMLLFLTLSAVGIRALWAFVAPDDVRTKQLIFEHARAEGARGGLLPAHSAPGDSPRAGTVEGEPPSNRGLPGAGGAHSAQARSQNPGTGQRGADAAPRGAQARLDGNTGSTLTRPGGEVR